MPARRATWRSCLTTTVGSLPSAFYDPTSPLRVRILQAGRPAVIDEAWFRERIAVAAARRAELPPTGTTGYRLIHGENDGLPGLVVDRYEDTLVIKLYTAAWAPWLSRVLPALALRSSRPAAHVLRLSRELMNRPEHLHGLEEGLLAGAGFEGPPGWCSSARTGCGSRRTSCAGRRPASSWTSARTGCASSGWRPGSGCSTCFAYTGGFSLYAARGAVRVR
jgi:23S rRNA (cytosine1962-C5)-methyltransferase